MAYANTSVPVDRSQAEIRKLLSKHGAQRFSFHEGADDAGVAWVALEFVHAESYDRPHMVRMAVPLKIVDNGELREKAKRAYSKTFDEVKSAAIEQENRRIWRVIFYSLKSRMEAIEEQVETFEQAFLPHLVDPGTGQTIWQRVQPAIDAGLLVIGGAGLPALGSGAK
jgi:hypothetical protein